MRLADYLYAMFYQRFCFYPDRLLFIVLGILGDFLSRTQISDAKNVYTYEKKTVFNESKVVK